MKTLCGLLHRLSVATAGTAAIEFMLVMPIGIVTYLGMAEYSHYMTVKAKVIDTALEIEDLIGRQKTVTATTFSTVCGLAGTMLAPVSLNGLQVSIAEEQVSSSGTTSINWKVSGTATSNTTPLACPKVTSPAVIALPANILNLPQVSSNSIIIVQVSYTYSRVTKNSIFSYLPYSISLPALSYQKIGYFRYEGAGLPTY